MYIKTWHRQENEKDHPYELFKAYLELGNSRAIDKVLKGSSETGRTRLYDYARINNWKERARDYDNERTRIEERARYAVIEEHAKSIEQRKVQINEEAWDVSKKLLAKAKAILELPIIKKEIYEDSGVTIINPINYKMADAIKMVELADKLARLSADMDTDKLNITVKEELRTLSENTGVSFEILMQEYITLTGAKIN